MASTTTTTKPPMIRIACIATNLISPKITDGVAKLLSKSDLVMLVKKSNGLQVNTSEAILSEAWDTISVNIKAGLLNEDAGCGVFGRLCSRSVLFIMKKQEAGPEGVDYKNFTHVNDVFQTELYQPLTRVCVQPTQPTPKEKKTRAPIQSQHTKHWLIRSD